jgi:hypothetical protein
MRNHKLLATLGETFSLLVPGVVVRRPALIRDRERRGF